MGKKYNTEEERLEAIKLQKRLYYEKNRQKVLDRSKNYYNINKKSINENNKVYHKLYNELNKEKLKEKRKINKNTANERAKNWYLLNPDKARETRKLYRNIGTNKITSKEQKKEWWKKNKNRLKIKYKEYYLKNKETIKIRNNKYQKNRRQTDIIYKLIGRMRNILYKILKLNGYSKKSRSHEILDCSFEYLNLHLESQFLPWMNWQNYGKYNGELNYGWDIDHIIPLSSAKTEEELLKLCHYTNLQPLCGKVNRDIKRDNLIK